MVALRTAASKLVGDAQTYYLLSHNVGAGMGDYKADQPNRVLKDAADLYAALARLMKDFVFDDKRARLRKSMRITRPRLSLPIRCSASPTCRSGSATIFASELVNFGRGHSLKPSEIPYNEAQTHLHRGGEALRALTTPGCRSPRHSSALRLTAENMVQASQGLGGPQPAEVARHARRPRRRAWRPSVLGSLPFKAGLTQAAERLDVAFRGV